MLGLRGRLCYFDPTLRRPPEFRLIVIRAGLNETVTSASCVICNWLPYLSFIIASASHVRTFASQGLTPQIVISYPISSHLRHICASSYLRFLSQIFTSSLSSSGLHILKPHLVFTRSDLHRRVTLSFSYHLQDFIMQLLSRLYNLIYLRLQNFISPLSGQPSSSFLFCEIRTLLSCSPNFSMYRNCFVDCEKWEGN